MSTPALKIGNPFVRIGLLITGFVVLSVSSFGQQKSDSVLMNIGGENITTSEVMTLYRKNNIRGAVLDKKSFEEYLELFINYKLKIRQALDAKMDTITSFKNELRYYRSQLAQPYMMDEEMSNNLVKEAYQRKLKDIRTSHILVTLDINANPEDTLKAWEKVMAIRKRIQSGEDFGKVAAEVSDDLSARDLSDGIKITPGNKGDLGYFSVFDMVYPFETAAYNTAVGSVSMPVRSDFGYHLVKVTDVQPALGEVLAAHILFRFPDKASSADSIALKIKVDSIFAKVKNGDDFSVLARNFSDDRTTAAKGGVLPWFGSNRMVPEIVVAVDGLKPGGYSSPFLSSYGWHILKILERKPVGAFEDIKDDLRQKVTRGDRLSALNDSFISKLKKRYGFAYDQKILDKFADEVTDEVFSGKWKISNSKKLTKKLMWFEDFEFKLQDLAEYIVETQRVMKKIPMKIYIAGKFNNFANKQLLDYEDEHLEVKYPEFKSLLQEYHDGLLVYALTDMNVWSKAEVDTIGLRKFYEKNRSNYLWDTRVEASIYSVLNATTAQKVRSMILKGVSEEEILKSYKSDTSKVVTIEHHVYLRGESPVVDLIDWKEGLSRNIDTDGTTTFVFVHKVIEPQPKSLSLIKGIVTADYQNYLEKTWMSELRKKYPYKINKVVFDQIEKSLQ
jgi:peptidyl-prolyl cis-trans isomerase SurA